METGLTGPNKYLFEHLLGAALRQTPAAVWAVDTFISRVSPFKFKFGIILRYSSLRCTLYTLVLSCYQRTVCVVISCGRAGIACKRVSHASI